MGRDACIFDLFGTLVPRVTSAQRTERRLVIAEILACDPLVYLRTSAELRHDRLSGRWRRLEDALVALSSADGFRPATDNVVRAAEHLRHRAAQDLRVTPESRAVLVAARTFGRVGLLSDCELDVAQVFARSQLSSLVDHATFSCVVGRTKPDPTGYLDCAQGLGVKADDVLFVGDGGSDELNGARALGAVAIHFNYPPFSPARSMDESAAAVAGTHEELMELLEEHMNGGGYGSAKNE